MSDIKKYIRVTQIARKPDKDEFTMSMKICSIGIMIIGFIGFAIFLLFILMGI